MATAVALPQPILSFTLCLSNPRSSCGSFSTLTQITGSCCLACTHPARQAAMASVAQHIITPAVIRAKYSGYVLSNGVKCVIVQDANAKMPAAAMCIRAGQLNDPVELPGLAHFCEHMLFMGTEKFPKEDEFDSFVSKASGLTNAFTEDCDTVYYFSVSDGSLEGALERFVEFFASPSFSAGAVAREVNAVHSEDEKNHNSDYWRLDELIRDFCNPKHPRSRYGNGNLTTLRDEPQRRGIDVRESLKTFHSRYYLADGATIVVVSMRSADEVLSLIEGPLARMKQGAVPRFSFLEAGEHLFTSAALGSWTNVRTVQKMRELRLMWAVRSPSSAWRTTPSAYIAHLLGHECDTSVLGVLKKRNWATGMLAGSHRVDDDFEVLDASVTLTVEGFRNALKVVDLLYQGIGQSIAHGVDAEVYKGMKAEERLFFESVDAGSPANHCVALAQNANATDLEHCWIGGNVVLEDDMEAVLAYVRQLTPQNCVMVMQWGDMPIDAATGATPAEGNPVESHAQQHDEEDDEDSQSAEEETAEETEQASESNASAEELFLSLPAFAQVRVSNVSRFHRALYQTVKIPEEHEARWQSLISGPYPPELALPSTNPFIATDFTIYPPAAEEAVDEIASPHAVTYVRKDAGHHSTFKMALRCNVLSPVASASPLNRLYTRVMHGILSNALTEMAYYAMLASLTNEVIFSPTGLGFAVEGPSQKLYEFFFAVVRKGLSMQVLQGTAEEYATYLETGVQKLKNVGMAQPYKVLHETQKKATRHTYYLFNEMIACESAATYEGYCTFVKQYLESGLLLECFVAGNVLSTQDVREMLVGRLEDLLGTLTIPIPLKETIPRVRDTYGPRAGDGKANESVLCSFDVLSMPPSNPADPNAAVVVDVIIGEATPRVMALTDTAMKLISSSFFNVLRTREALGYVVFAESSVDYCTAHALFVVQSALKDVDCVYLLSRIVAFLSAVEAQLDTVCSAEEVEKVKRGLIAALEKVPDSVEGDVKRLEGEYVSLSKFESRQRTIAALLAITAEDVKSHLRNYFFNNRSESRALALCINNARTVAADVLAEPGNRRVPLPSVRSRQEDSDDAPGDASEDTEPLTLPTFSDGSSCVEITSYASALEYQHGLCLVKCNAY
ncbi:phosphoglycan beta 1,3 galactosyltransferase 5 [Leishmania donovani]|uniref:Phosphoglycan beta 1,3 galactosyltransferase 5 n=1 Tax=Leishmania donovani TaxID=5661 RepID=A0A3S7X521_LEIDO|nr:phosphoglycan beta 1,3 galactosyltransferase 5 [Leishmania donovani]